MNGPEDAPVAARACDLEWRIPEQDEVSHATLVHAVAEIIEVGSSASRVGLRRAACVLGEVRRAIWTLPSVATRVRVLGIPQTVPAAGRSCADLMALLQPDEDAGEPHRPAR